MNTNKLSPKTAEYYGFLKPRMWAQYGENFKGVCLAFNKNILLEDIQILKAAKIIADEIAYSNFEDFYSWDIHVDAYSETERNNRYETYYNFEIERCLQQVLLRKHRDYEHENEFRIIKVSSENNDDIFRFTESLKCIVFNHRYFMKSKVVQLLRFADDYNVPLVGINWDANQICIDVHD